MTNDARQKALSILNALNDGRRTLDRVLESVLDESGRFSRKDQALVNALVFGVLRWRNRLDWIVGRFSNTPIRKIDPNILNILRIGLYQIVYLDRVPVSAAVNTSVELAKNRSAPWVVRFVNAVLRKASGGYAALNWPDAGTDPVAFLAINKSFPEWLLDRWLPRFGFAETVDLCDAINRIPPITIRANSLKTNRAALLAALSADVRQAEMTLYAPDGIHLHTPRVSIPSLDAFREGGFQVQDEAAQLATCLLGPCPGEHVLDACAGRGGKTGHMAQLMQNRGRIVAFDHDPQKLSQNRREMARLGVLIADFYSGDLNRSPCDVPFAPFDRILLDAPCSGLGVLRRNPDTKWATAKRHLNRYRDRQLRFLDHLAPLLKPGGVMLYAVCSFEPEENESVVEAFLRTHPDFRVDKHPDMQTGRPVSLIDRNGFMRTLPHVHGMDGFFSVRLRRVS